jgi:epoxyqueuosine reductase
MADREQDIAEDRAGLGREIQAVARQLGFDLAGIAPAAHAVSSLDMARYQAWLVAGYHGQMGYLARPDAVARRADLVRILPGVQSIVVVALNYYIAPLPAPLRDDPSRGILASYAWGSDYHDRMLPHLQRLAAAIQEEIGRPVATRAYVDTGPLLERALAVRAGLGFVGKNTNLIHPRLGSWLFLGELLLAVDAAVPGEEAQGTCGRCSRCLEACPTGALVAPYVLDARRCISYLTIEHKGSIPHELRPLIGNRIFGCDICQEVCPWNRRFARPASRPTLQPAAALPPAGSLWPAPDDVAPPLPVLLGLDEAAFQRRFAGSPVKRAKRRGLLRNVAVALGNWGDPSAVPGLARALGDAEPLVRGHAAWALGRIGTGKARQALRQALADERDGEVREEITAALEASQ